MQANDFHFLREHVGKEVKVGRGGPHSHKGRLVSAQFDHVVIEDGKGDIYYCPCNHIKDVSVMNDQEHKKDSDAGQDLRSKPTPTARFTRHFKNVLWGMEDSPVQINKGGPEKVEGILREIHPHHIVVEHKKEIVHIMKSHIKSLKWLQEDPSQKKNEE